MSLLALLCLLAGARPTYAQAPPLGPLPAFPPEDAAAPAAPPAQKFFGDSKFRFQFLVVDQYSYELHPFRQLTGSNEFDANRAGENFSSDLGTNKSDRDSDFFIRALHALPPFALEYTWPVNNLPFPKGFGIGLDYIHIQQTSRDAAGKTVNASPPLPTIIMDSFYIAIPFRFYGFDPNQPGINYFVGASIGVLNGNMLVGTGLGNPTEQVVSFSKGSVGAFRMGLEASGDNLGFRFEIMLVNATEVGFDSNPFFGQTTTEVDMSGTILRISLFYRPD